LHLGVNALDEKHYAGWKGELKSCENDAEDMAAVAKKVGLKPKVLLAKAATRAAVLGGLKEAGKQLKAGEVFVLTYSGLGTQVLDISGDEMGLMDEAWCLHDAMVIDDELQSEVSRFPKGSRVFLLIDSSPSGSVPRPFMPEPDPPPAGQRPRLVSPLQATKIYRQNERFYDGLQKAVKPVTSMGPQVVAIHACQRNQAAIDGKDNGVFTQHVLHLWNGGSFEGSYLRFYEQLVARMPSTQTPMLRTHGDVGALLDLPLLT